VLDLVEEPLLQSPAGPAQTSTASNQGDFGIGFASVRYLHLSQDVDRGRTL